MGKHCSQAVEDTLHTQQGFLEGHCLPTEEPPCRDPKTEGGVIVRTRQQNSSVLTTRSTVRKGPHEREADSHLTKIMCNPLSDYIWVLQERPLGLPPHLPCPSSSSREARSSVRKKKLEEKSQCQILSPRQTQSRRKALTLDEVSSFDAYI